MYLYLLAFLIALLESLAFVGLTFPGTILIVGIGCLATLGLYDFWTIVLIVTMGGSISNILDYEYAKNIREYARKKPQLRAHIDRTKIWYKKYGWKSILLARFKGSVRSLISVVARTQQKKRNIFYAETIIGALCGAMIRLGIGYIATQSALIAFLWISRKNSFMLALALASIPLFALWKWTLRRGKNALIIVFSLLKTGAKSMLQHPRMQPWMRRYPHVNAFIRRHCTQEDFFGLPFTILLCCMVYLLILLWQIIQAEISGGPLHIIDTQVENLILTFRNDEFIQLFYTLTLLCNAPIIIAISISMSIVFWLRKKRMLLCGLWINLLLTSIVIWNGKLLFHRLRPASMLNIMTESTYAFPSGHATYGISLYGFLAYVALRSSDLSWRLKSTTVFGCIVLITLIDISRLYLGVHFLSDIFAGTTIGLFILLWSICITEFIGWYQGEPPCSARVSKKLFFILATCISAIAVIIITLTPRPKFAKIPPPSPEEKTIAAQNVLEAFPTQSSRRTETLSGNMQEPLNILLLAQNDTCLETQLETAGWYKAEAVSPMTLYKALRASVLNESYIQAPVTPYFYKTEPHTFAFEQETSMQTIRTRHHIRIWKTPYRIGENALYAATASFDKGLKWGGIRLFLTHSIAADIDEEREHVIASLTKHKKIRNAETLQFVPPMTGTNFTGDRFQTDGRSAVLVIHSCTE